MKKTLLILFCYILLLGMPGCSNSQDEKNKMHNNELWGKIAIYKYYELNGKPTSREYRDNLTFTILDVDSLSKIKNIFSNAKKIDDICRSGCTNKRCIDCVNPDVPSYALEITDKNNKQLHIIDLYLYDLGVVYISYQDISGTNYYKVSEDDIKILRELTVHKQKSGKISKYEIKNDSVSMSIKEKSLTNVGATFILVNYTNNSYIYGEDYVIEYEQDGRWYTLGTIIDNYGFNAIGYILESNASKEIEVEWEWLYGKLEYGKYRIIKGVSRDIDRPINESDMVYIGVEFIVE